MKIKNIILSALIIQGCFFSTSIYADIKFQGFINTSPFGGAWLITDFIYPDADSAYAGICSENGFGFEGGAYCVVPANTYSNQTSDLNVSSTIGSTTCSDFVQPDGSCASTDPNVKDCSSNTDTQMASFFSTGTSVSIDGCSYTIGAKVCGYDGFCTGTVTGTGTASDPNDSTSVDGNPVNDPNLNDTVTTDNTGTYTTDTTTVDNGDGTTTDTTTDTSSSSNNVKDTITFDGTTSIVINSDGTQTTTTTVTTTTTKADGSQSQTSSTTSQTSSGGLTVTNTNINTGQTTTTTTQPTINTRTTGSSTEYDSNGDIISRTYNDPVTTIEEPTDPNCPSCVPDVENYVKGDFTSLDAAIESLKTYDTSSYEMPSLSIALGSLGSCDNSNFSITVLGSNFNPDICTWVIILQSVLYWFFGALTVYYLYHLATNMGRIA